MSKRTTKADVILEGALERLNDAKARVRAAQAELDSANATMFAHAETYESLKKAFARAPADDKGKDKGKGRPAGSKNRGLPKGTPPQSQLAPPNGGDTDTQVGGE